MSGKHVPSFGHGLLFGNAVLVPATLSATLVTTPAGVWCDIYGVTITSSDTTVQTVTLSDGTTSVVYEVGAPSPVCDDVVVPVRFKQNATLTATAGAITTAKQISVVVRGVAVFT